MTDPLRDALFEAMAAYTHARRLAGLELDKQALARWKKILEDTMQPADAEPGTMPDDKAVAAHLALAAYHRALAKGAALDIVHEYHAALADSFQCEAERIPERTAARARIEARFAEGNDDDDA